MIDIKPRFEIIDDDQAFDHSTGLIWLRDYVPGGKRPWKESITAAEALNVGGYKWRAPTIREQLSIVDYDRHDPAFDTDVFRGGSHWVWTSTPLHSSPSDCADCAWFVFFNSGFAGWDSQNNNGFVRAVRVGQSLEIGSPTPVAAVDVEHVINRGHAIGKDYGFQLALIAVQKLLVDEIKGDSHDRCRLDLISKVQGLTLEQRS